MDGNVMDSPGQRRRAAVCAQAASGVAAAGVVTLGLMYAIEVPTNGPFIFGTTNDVLGAAANVLFLPVYAELSSELPPGTAREVLLPVALGASVIGAASSALLVARVLPFSASTAVSVAAMEAQAVWMLVAHDLLLRGPAFPARLGRLGRAIGAGILAGSAVVGIGLTLPRGSAAQRFTIVAGALPGVTAWLAWPLWLHLAAGHLQGPPQPDPAGG